MFCQNVEKKALFPFTFNDIRNSIIDGETLANLDNFDNTNRVQTAVQMTREMKTDNGCNVTLIFPLKSRSGVRRRIAEMFVAALEKGMKDS